MVRRVGVLLRQRVGCQGGCLFNKGEEPQGPVVVATDVSRPEAERGRWSHSEGIQRDLGCACGGGGWEGGGRVSWRGGATKPQR